MPIERIASCECGAVKLHARGDPIVSAVCYCGDCQAGGIQLENAGAHKDFRDAWGGTEYATYADGRIAPMDGKTLLRGFRLRNDSPTVRYLARCCGSAMLLKFGPGWWTSIYRVRFGSSAPPLEMRNKAKHAKFSTLPADVPQYRGFPARLFGRLAIAGISTGFRRRTY